jgi:hypothetical protein
MRKGARLGSRLFGAMVWKLLIIETFFQGKLNKIQTELYWNLGAFLMLLESPQQVRFNRVYFTIFRAKVWKILIFEQIWLLGFQTNCKNRV